MQVCQLPRLCVTSVSGGGGKTLLALGLGRALSATYAVKPFKKGPDYIDAAWLSLACGRAATNLDPFFLQADALSTLFYRSLALTCKEANNVFALIEGNRGLYDGLNVTGLYSTAELARILDCPLLLSLNCTKMTRTIAALLQGIVHFEEGLHFCGVVLNHVGSTRHESILRTTVENYTDLTVIGALPRLSENPLPERHMGLASYGTHLAEDVQLKLDMLATLIRNNIDLSKLTEYAKNFSHKTKEQTVTPEVTFIPDKPTSLSTDPPPCIGYVRDSALWFYYEENLQALSDAGAKLQLLNMFDVQDTAWEQLDGLYLGGGFPEDYAPQLANSPAKVHIFRLAQMGMPIYAECGGLFLLARSLLLDGKTWPMTGIFPMNVLFCKRPQGLGYVEGTITGDNPFFPVGMSLRGHEFHYSRCICADNTTFSLELTRGTGIKKQAQRGWDAVVFKKVWASYTHIFAPALPCWAKNFVQQAGLFKFSCSLT